MKLHDFRSRAAVSAVLIALVTFLILFAFSPWFQYIVALFVSLLTGVAMWEYEQFAKAKGGQMIMPALIAAAMVVVYSFFLEAKFPSITGLPLALFFISFLVLFALHFNEKDGAVVDLAVSSFGLLYIAVPMGMILGILYFGGGQDGRWWIAYLLVVTKITDVGAYFGGNLWGRRKLAPSISPGKTVEGAIVGLACALAASFVFYLIGDYSGSQFRLSFLEWIILGFILGIVGQFGDLSESLLKRDANKKDSNALPGLGGVLDSLDSLLFNAMIIYVHLNYIKL
jgi:phosphatidate cytidylyltransferase